MEENNLSNQQDYKMKEHCAKDQSSSKSRFLQKFTGKLNVITKHGQIKDENSLRLPAINTSVTKRSNTVNMRPSKESAYSFFTNRRSNSTESSTIRKGALKHLTQNYEGENIDVSNKFLKKSESRNLKKICLKHIEMEPLSAQPYSKFRSTRKNTNVEDYQNLTNSFNLGSKLRNSDYHNFLRELNHVSDSINENNRRATLKNDKENLEMNY